MDNIFQLSGEELYEKALTYKLDKDYTNYAIYITLAADCGIKLAQHLFCEDEVMGLQDCSISVPLYEKFIQDLKPDSLGYLETELGYIY